MNLRTFSRSGLRLLLLGLALWLSFFWQLGAVPLYDLDEGAFTEATREMLASGNFITPYKDGQPRYDKPILIYWLQALSAHWFGLNEFALRLPSALAALAWVWALWRFARRFLDGDTASIAALFMVLSLEVSLIAKAATADALLNLFLSLSLLGIYRWYQQPEDRTLLGIYAWIGLGFLTKGPVAVFFPLVISLLFFASQGAWKRWWQALYFPRGWAVFLLLVLPWHLAVYWDSGPGFFERFFLKHNLGRFSGVIHGHEGFFGYYFLVLPLILLPFSGGLVALIPHLRALWTDALNRFLMLWFLSVFLFFSFSRTQLPHYLLYGATPLFLLLARYRAALRNPWVAYAPPLLFFLLLLGLPELLDLAAQRSTRVHELALLQLGREQLDGRYRLAVGLGVLLVVALFRMPKLPPWQGLLIVGFAQVLLLYGVLVPRVFAVLQTPVKEAAQLARTLAKPTVRYRTNLPSFSFYRGAITPARIPKPGELVFLRIDKRASLSREIPPDQQALRFQRGQVALIEIKGGWESPGLASGP